MSDSDHNDIQKLNNAIVSRILNKGYTTMWVKPMINGFKNPKMWDILEYLLEKNQVLKSQMFEDLNITERDYHEAQSLGIAFQYCNYLCEVGDPGKARIKISSLAEDFAYAIMSLTPGYETAYIDHLVECRRKLKEERDNDDNNRRMEETT